MSSELSTVWIVKSREGRYYCDAGMFWSESRFLAHRFCSPTRAKLIADTSAGAKVMTIRKAER